LRRCCWFAVISAALNRLQGNHIEDDEHNPKEASTIFSLGLLSSRTALIFARMSATVVVPMKFKIGHKKAAVKLIWKHSGFDLMGRAGIEPATHGFSGHTPVKGNASSANDLADASICGAARALQLGPDLQEIIDGWDQLSAADRAAVLGMVRARICAKGGRASGAVLDG